MFAAKLISFSWEDVEDETKTVDAENATDVRIFALKLYKSFLTYLDDLRDIEKDQFDQLRYVCHSSNMTLTAIKCFIIGHWLLMTMKRLSGVFTKP